MTLRLQFSGKDDMVRTVRNSGTSHWFSPDAMRFFHTRIGETLYGRVFVTSEVNPSGERRYSIRLLCDSSDNYVVQTIGAFGAYASRSGAHGAASRLAKFINGRPALDRYVDDATCNYLADRVDIPFTGF